ncbi:MAG: transglutaminase family protein, partial [Candidatus Binatia bacterium]
MRVLVQHRSRYEYPSPAALGPHRLRLRPAAHAHATIESYGLTLRPEPSIRWQQDPAGNHVAYAVFPNGTRIDALEVGIDMALDLRPVNPFDFFVDPLAERVPFELGGQLRSELAPYLSLDHPWLACGERFERLLKSLPPDGKTATFLVEVNRAVNAAIRYVIREEPGIWTPEETLAQGRGSCRDSAVLLLALLRARGIAARFASGYLIQLRDEGMLPDEPRGVDRDVVDLHAWAEAYVPGAGWIGLDATSGLLCGEGHVPLACTATPALAAPIEGTSNVMASSVTFEMRVGRLGHEPRPSAPYEELLWQEMLAAGDAVDARLDALGLR